EHIPLPNLELCRKDTGKGRAPDSAVECRRKGCHIKSQVNIMGISDDPHLCPDPYRKLADHCGDGALWPDACHREKGADGRKEGSRKSPVVAPGLSFPHGFHGTSVDYVWGMEVLLAEPNEEGEDQHPRWYSPPVGQYKIIL